VKIKLWVLNLGGPVKVAKLNEEQAIEQGAEILGEFVIFSIAALCLVLDYVRSSRKERLKKMENGIFEIGMLSERQDAQIRELTRAVLAMKPKTPNLKEYVPQPITLERDPELGNLVVKAEAPSPDNDVRKS
jgi:hypothetical protein